MYVARGRMQLSTLRSLMVWGLLLTFTPDAWARGSPIPFEVYVEGSAHCEPDAFSAKLTKRSSRLRPSQRGEDRAEFRLDITKQESVITGHLRVRESDGNETTRTISGANCDEVLSALAIVAAVLVDPSASAAEAPSVSPLKPKAPTIESFAPATRLTRWRFAGGVGAGIETAISPRLAATVSLQGEASLLGLGLFSPRFALALHRSAGNTLETPNGSAHFQWTAARVAGCPARLAISEQLSFRPCLFFDLGVLAASGHQTYGGESARVAWYGLGGVARAEYVPVAPLALGLDAGVMLPLVHDRFYFDPGAATDTLALPRLGLTLRAGIAVYFE